MKKNCILPIHVGGTIASAESKTGFRPQLSFADLLAKIDRGLSGDRHLATAQSPFGEFGIDSASMQIPHIQKIGKTILDNYDSHDAFLITHGTDTLAYTASMLSFMLRGIQKPVIVTGAQKTLEDDKNDVTGNLETAMLGASTSNCGVWVAFNRKIIKAVRATKIDIGVDSLDAFSSNIMTEIPISKFQQDDYSVNKGQTEKFSTKASEDLDIYCLSHTTNPVLLSRYLDNSGFRALIVLIYGMSGHREELMEILSRWARDNEGIIIAKTHSPYGSTDLSKYELGVKALQMGILPSLDMTLESTYAKASTILAHNSDPAEFSKLFYANFCDELDESGVQKFMKKAASRLSAS
ncbi:MAG: asparaginase domain-containing protein [Desulfobulbia bacterium]